MKKSLNKKIWLIIGAVGLVGLAALFVFYYFDQSANITDLSSPTVKPVVAYPRLIDGVLVEDESKVSSAVAAVMIDNHFDAWPQVGLDQAAVVYEAPVEGAISRLLAIFSLDDNSPKIGPVRSARPYFVDWADEYGASYWHSGGSPEALQKLQSSGITDVNEFYNGSYFYRDKRLYAPHNLFTTSDHLNNYYQDHDLSLVPTFRPWQFVEASPLITPVTTQISFNYSPSSTYQIIWRYDVQSNTYQRSQGDNPVWSASNVIWQFADIKTIDAIGRQKITTSGQGRAIIVNNGDKIEGSWKKNMADRRTIFYDQNNQEIKLVRGSTWVEIVPTDWPVDFSN